MDNRGAAIVAAARGLVGARTAPQGRNTATGIDCLGLAWLALRSGGIELRVPQDYSLRADNRARLAEGLQAAGLVPVAKADMAPGDLVIFAVSAGQHHLAVWAGETIVHADFAARRVVETHVPVEWVWIAARRAGGEE